MGCVKVKTGLRCHAVIPDELVLLEQLQAKSSEMKV